MIYEKLVEKISQSSGLALEEIESKVEAKRNKLSGLISKEGAAQIVAAELGISFDNEKVKLSELADGMKRANVIGQITKIFPVREFNKNGREGKVVNFFIGDETSSARIVLWDSNHISLIENSELKEGDVVEISNGNVRNAEVHLSGFSDIKKNKEKIENVKTELVVQGGSLKNASAGSSMKVRAVIVQAFEPRYFDSKQNEGEKGVLLNVVLDDGTETIRMVLFGENIKKLVDVSDEDLFSAEKLGEKVKEVLGEERFFSGNFRINSFTSKLEMTANGVEDVNFDELVKELEAKV